MKRSLSVLAVVLSLTSVTAHAQYYPYNPYDRHSVPANNYARGYTQGSANAYTGMAVGGSAFMNGLAIGTAPPAVAVAPGPYYGGPPPGTPYGLPVAPPAYGYGPAPYTPYGGAPYAVPYIR